MILAPKIKKANSFWIFSVFGRNMWNSDKISSKSEQKSMKEWKKNEFFQKNAKKIEKNAKTFDEKILKYWGLSGAKACKSCRSRQELSNEYLLAKIRFDTAENESLKVCQTFAKS